MVDTIKLRMRIVEMGMNQIDVADKTGIPPSNFSRKIRNKMAFSTDEVFRIADVLEIKPEDFKRYFFVH